jgi:hypothetical protein
MNQRTKKWTPIAELETLVDALEAELLAAGDDEIKTELGHLQVPRDPLVGCGETPEAAGHRHGVGRPDGAVALAFSSWSTRRETGLKGH